MTKRNRPTMKRQRALESALALLMEAVDLQSQSFKLDALVTPSNPGGQMTAIRRNGQAVHRWDFQRQAMLVARSILNGADASLLLEKIK